MSSRIEAGSTVTDLAVTAMTASYIGATALFASRGAQPPMLAVATLLAMPLVALVTRALLTVWPGRLTAVLRACWPAFIGPIAYLAEIQVIAMERFRYMDAVLAAIDARLHLVNPSWRGGPLEEVANFWYLTIYLIPLVAVIIALRWGIEAATRLNEALALCTLVCGLGWLLLPAGSYFPGGSPTDVPWGPFTAIVHRLYSTYPHAAAAFPSQHVADASALAAVVRQLGGSRWVWVWAGCVAGATIIGGYHFAADAAVGWLVGLAAVKATGLGQPATVGAAPAIGKVK